MSEQKRMTPQEISKAEDDMIYDILTSGNVALIYETFGKPGLKYSIQMGALTKEQVVSYCIEQKKYLGENPPDIFKLDSNDDSAYFNSSLELSMDGIDETIDKMEISMENLDVLLTSLNSENISNILNTIEEKLKTLENVKDLQDIEENYYLKEAINIYILNQTPNASPENKEQSNRLINECLHREAELSGRTIEEVRIQFEEEKEKINMEEISKYEDKKVLENLIEKVKVCLEETSNEDVLHASLDTQLDYIIDNVLKDNGEVTPSFNCRLDEFVENNPNMFQLATESEMEDDSFDFNN